MIIRCNLSNLLWGFNKTRMATKRLGVNVSAWIAKKNKKNPPVLGEFPLGELNISRKSQSFTGFD